MIFFPLSLIAGTIIARRWTLPRGLAAATTIFAIAVVVAWKVQGFTPSPRDLLWLALAWALAGIGYWWSPRRLAGTAASSP